MTSRKEGRRSGRRDHGRRRQGQAGDCGRQASPAAEPVDLFADLGKAADALRCISSEAPQLAKSLWHVSRLADLLSSFASLQQLREMGSRREGDGSAIPQEMADQLKAMGATLVTMAQEEVAELLSEPTCEIVYIGDYCEYAAGIVDLVKANADLMAKPGSAIAKPSDAADVKLGATTPNKTTRRRRRADCGAHRRE
jgi:hypothetical protein